MTKKLPATLFRHLTGLFLSLSITSMIGTIGFYSIGYGREYYHTSTSIELYGTFGWFTFSTYLFHLMILSIAIIIILLLIGPEIFDINSDQHLQNGEIS